MLKAVHIEILLFGGWCALLPTLISDQAWVNVLVGLFFIAMGADRISKATK